MKKLLKRSLILVFCFCLILTSFLYVKAEDNDSDTIDITDTYFVITAQKEAQLKVPFNKNWFKKDATQYDHDLAKLSLGLATASFRPSKAATPDKQADENVLTFLGEAGFTDLRSDDYDKNPSMYTVSTVMGHQTIGEGDEAFELIAVGVCGQGYMDEWESNFSIGGGDIPEGFSRSAQLVYDRIFGYLANYHIRGPIKIWMSGFSRAAAITNITAAWLSDSDFFSEETVFAYTFGTPMTTREVNYKYYRNIYNICGKMDPVTNVPFADWGYYRYGTTLFTPAQETDSDFATKRLKANEIYKQITGIDFWSNTGMNSQLRVIMDYLLKICPNVETYVLSLQDHLINLWEKHDVRSVIRNLMEMANDPFLINENNRHEANMLLNYISYLLLDYTVKDNGFRRWNNSASLASNMAQAHTPELYISWVFSVNRAQDLYSGYTFFTQLYIDGDVTVTLSKEGRDLERMSSQEEIDTSIHRYINKNDNKIVVLIPGDRDYQIAVDANSDCTISMMEADYEAGRQAPAQATIHYFEAKEGDTIAADFYHTGISEYSVEDSYSETAEFDSEEYLDTNRFIAFERSNIANLTWRDLILVIYIILLILVITVAMVFSILINWMRHRRLRNKGYIPKNVKFRPLPIICMFLILEFYLTGEVYKLLYSAPSNGVSYSKVMITILTVIIAFYGYRRRKDRFHLLIMLSVFLLGAADVLMNVSIRLGACLHIGAYTFLAYNFIREEKPDASQYFAWLIMAALGILFVMTRDGTFGILRVLAVLYVLSSTAMTVAAFPISPRTFRGATLLLLSGFLLIINQVYGTTFFSHLISLGVYYLAVVTLASSGSGFIRRRAIIESVLEDDDETKQPQNA